MDDFFISAKIGTLMKKSTTNIKKNMKSEKKKKYVRIWFASLIFL